MFYHCPSTCSVSSITNFYLKSLIPFFNPARNIHRYNIRLFSRMTYVILKARKKVWNLQHKLSGDKVWNDVSDDIKLLSLSNVLGKSLNQFLLLNTNCRFTKTIFLLALRCLILAHLAIFCCLYFSTSFILFCVLCSVCACVVPGPLI